jgi:hypothetical protein
MISNPYFGQYTLQNPSYILTKINRDRLDENAKKGIMVAVAHVHRQKQMNLYFSEVIKLLTDTGYPLVGLKGYFLQQIYYPPEHVRLFGDIDILTSTRIGYQLYRILKQDGFSVTDYNSLSYNNESNIILFHRLAFQFTQHVEMERIISETSQKNRVEIHSNLNMDCPNHRLRFLLKRMIDDSIEKNTKEFSVHVFAPEDHILYLMYHTIRHLSYVSLSQNKISINLQSFYDVALVASSEFVDWEKFSKRTAEYNIAPFISLFTIMFSEIFPDLIPKDVLQKVAVLAESARFTWKHIYRRIIRLQPNSLILGDFDSFPLVKSSLQMVASLEEPSVRNTRNIWNLFSSIVPSN